MEVAYGVVWREAGTEHGGRLIVGPHSLQLAVLGVEEDDSREIEFDEIAVVELRRSLVAPPHPRLVLALHDGAAIEIESVAEDWISVELLQKVLGHILGASRGAQRLLIAVKLRPKCRDAAAALLASGPPFDPGSTALVLHDAYLLDDEVLFLFETDDLDEAKQLLERDGWDTVSAWSEVATGEVRLAEHAYSWTRRGALSERAVSPGLGL